MNEIYFMVDIEADGPIPGPFSMLNFGCVAMDIKGRELGEYTANLLELEGARNHPDTMKWWEGYPEVWKSIRENPEDPAKVMVLFNRWIDGLCRDHKATPVMVSFPATYDHMWLYWYSHHLVKTCRFSFAGLDVKSAAWYAMGCKNFKHSTKRNFPKSWFKGAVKHTHHGLDDARRLGTIFKNMVAER